MKSGLLEMLVFQDPYQAPSEVIALANLGPILLPSEQLWKYGLVKDPSTNKYFVFGNQSIYSITGSTWATSTVGTWPVGMPKNPFAQPPVYIGAGEFAINIFQQEKYIYKWNSGLNTIGGPSGAEIDLDTLSWSGNKVRLMFMMPNSSDKQVYLAMKPGNKIFYTNPILGPNTISEEITIPGCTTVTDSRNHNMNNNDNSLYRFCTEDKFYETTSSGTREIPFPTKYSTYQCWYLRRAGIGGFQRLVLFADGLLMVIDTNPAHNQAFQIIARKRLFGQNFFVSFLD